MVLFNQLLSERESHRQKLLELGWNEKESRKRREHDLFGTDSEDEAKG